MDKKKEHAIELIKANFGDFSADDKSKSFYDRTFLRDLDALNKKQADEQEGRMQKRKR